MWEGVGVLSVDCPNILNLRSILVCAVVFLGLGPINPGMLLGPRVLATLRLVVSQYPCVSYVLERMG